MFSVCGNYFGEHTIRVARAAGPKCTRLIVLAINQYQILLVNLLCGSLPVDISLRSFFFLLSFLPFDFNGLALVLVLVGLWADWPVHVKKKSRVCQVSVLLINLYMTWFGALPDRPVGLSRACCIHTRKRERRD